jgi:predicted nucleic acid-binding protein
MVSVVFDTSVLVSAFLTRHQPRGVSNELLRFVAEGKIELYLSADIITEALATLVRNRRAQSNYRYTPQMAEAFCADLFDLARIIEDPPADTRRGAARPRRRQDHRLRARRRR